MNVSRYDFTKPAPLTAAVRDRFTSWSRSALALTNKSWSKQLPVRMEAVLKEWEAVYARQALARLPEPCLAYRVILAGGKLTTLLVLPRKLMLNLVAALLGDDGAAPEERDLTMVEEGLADYFLVEYWLTAFRETWPGGPTASWVLDGRDANPARSRLYAPEESLQAFHWLIRGPWGDAAGVWLFPQTAFLGALAGTEQTAGQAPEPISPARRASAVQALPILVQVILGTAELKLSQLRRLQVGDVLVLDKAGENQASACVGARELYRGRIGRRGSSKAFQIKSLPEK